MLAGKVLVAGSSLVSRTRSRFGALRPQPKHSPKYFIGRANPTVCRFGAQRHLLQTLEDNLGEVVLALLAAGAVAIGAALGSLSAMVLSMASMAALTTVLIDARRHRRDPRLVMTPTPYNKKAVHSQSLQLRLAPFCSCLCQHSSKHHSSNNPATSVPLWMLGAMVQMFRRHGADVRGYGADVRGYGADECMPSPLLLLVRPTDRGRCAAIVAWGQLSDAGRVPVIASPVHPLPRAHQWPRGDRPRGLVPQNSRGAKYE
eukprot:1184021-Prorocentrum_minimum.AAC.1